VAPRDRTIITFAAAQAMIDATWSDMDLRYPPAVERFSRRATTTIASANRLSLHLPDRIPAWCLLVVFESQGPACKQYGLREVPSATSSPLIQRGLVTLPGAGKSR